VLVDKQRSDPVKEAGYNINQVKRLYKAALLIDEMGIRTCMQNHDAVGALNIVQKVLNHPLYKVEEDVGRNMKPVSHQK